MEYEIDSENVEIIIKEEKHKLSNEEINLLKLPCSATNAFESSNNHFTRYEILLKLDDVYFIENVKIVGEAEDLNINKIKFLNVINNIWETAAFYNIDEMGLTQSIKIEVIILSEFNSQRTITGTDLDTNARVFAQGGGTNYNNLANIDNAIENRIACMNNNNRLSINNKNSINHGSNFNIKNSLSNSNSIKNYNLTSRVYNVLPIINSIKKLVVNAQYLYSIPNSTVLMNLINLNNFFLNSGPHAFNNYSNNNNNFSSTTKSTTFKNNTNNKKSKVSSNTNNNNNNNNYNGHNNNYNINFQSLANPNYIISLFLSATCMTQSRLFIQAWELLNKMQSILLSNEDDGCITATFSIIFRQQNFVNNTRQNFFGGKSRENAKHSIAAKIEIIKSACLFEHGHTQPFLDSLLTATCIYYSSDYTSIKKGINWSKINDYNPDKFYVQNFLAKNGKKIIELLLFCLNDKCEILVISALKIIEYTIDYQPAIISGYFPKIIKSLLRMIYPITRLNRELDPKKPLSLDGLEFEDFYNFLAKNKEFDDFIQVFTNKDNYFPKELLLKFISVNFHCGGGADNNLNSKNNLNKSNNNNNSINGNFNNNALTLSSNLNSGNIGSNLENKALSCVLLKQVNYTLDTVISNIDNLCFSEVNNIFVKSNRLLVEILKYDLDNITMFNVIKLVKKIYENVNASAGDLGKSASRSNKTDKQFSELISAILTISVNPKIICKELSEVCSYKNTNNAYNVNNDNGNKNSKHSENSFSKFISNSNTGFSFRGSNNRVSNNNTKNSGGGLNGYYNFFNSLKYFELFENNEKSNTMLFALERLSEINFLSYAENPNCENLNWIKLNIEILVKYIKKNIESFTSNLNSNNTNNNNSSSNTNSNPNLNSRNNNFNNNNNNGNSSSNIINNTNSINSNANNNCYLNLFCIFYLYVNLNLLKILYLEREDLKFNSIFNLKFKSNIELIKPLLSLVNPLLELEEICLRVKDCFFVFDLAMEILASLKIKFSEFFNFNFNKVFLPQLNSLKNRMLEYGIFKENTYFLDKVLPFIEITSPNTNEERQNVVKILKEIFEVILNNFANFYDEDIFIVYNQLLEKLSADLDQDLIMKIIKSIIFKYNYKGQNFKISTKKLFELFVNKIEYFSIFKNEIVNSTKSIFLNSLVTESLQVNKASGSSLSVGPGSLSNNQVYEYLEKLELYKKFVEYLKDSYKTIDKKHNGIFDYLFFFAASQQGVFNTINNCFHETTILRWVEISSKSLDLLEIIIDLCIIDENELYKYLDILGNCINESIPIIANSIKLNNLFINQENFKLLTRLAQISSYLLEKSQKKFFEFESEKNSIFKIINFNTSNSNSSSNNNNNFDAFTSSNFLNNNNNNNNNFNANSIKTLDLTFIKTHIYSFVYKSIGNAYKIKNVANFKSFTNEIMNFLEALILKHDDFSQDSKAMQVFSDYFNSILNTYLNTQDDLYLIFCLEIIIKFYEIRFDENSEENKEEQNNDFFSSNKVSEPLKNLIPKPIWEKIFMLTEHPNFKLNIFSSYIINYLKPDCLTDKMQEKANFIKQKKEELNEIKNHFNDKFGILSIKKNAEINLNHNINHYNHNHNRNNDIENYSVVNSLNLINNLHNNNDNNLNSNTNSANYNNNNNNNNLNEFGNMHITNLLSDSNNFSSSLNLENNIILNKANFNGLQQQMNVADDATENPTFKGLWYSESEMQNLRNYIKENIIGIGKLRNDISNVFKSISPYDEKDELDLCGKKHADSELTDDIDFIEVIPENENSEDENFEDENEEENEKTNFNNYRKNKNLQIRNQSNKQGENEEAGAADGFYYDKERDEYLDLAELGVLEVDDDIFENFDEENIPVIKNIYKRKKGSAEKFKTNQSNRNMFLSNQNQLISHNNRNQPCDEFGNGKSNSYQNNNNNNVTAQGNAENSKNVMNSNLEKKTTDLRNYDASRNIKENNLAASSNRKACDNFFENLNLESKDLQIKKKQKRPINGLRPTTPPVKQNEDLNPLKNTITKSNNTAKPNSTNQANINSSKSNPDQLQSQSQEAQNTPKIPSQYYEKKQTTSRNPPSILNNNTSNKPKLDSNPNSFGNRNSREHKQILNTDDPSHKYEIKSMEDLFIEDADNFSDNELLFGNQNRDGNLMKLGEEQDNEVNRDTSYLLNENAGEEKELDFINYDELALDSFENLNLEDFKRGTTNALNSNLNSNNNNNTNNLNKKLESKNYAKHNIKIANLVQSDVNNNDYIKNNNGSFNLKKLKIKTDFNDFESECLENNYDDAELDAQENLGLDKHLDANVNAAAIRQKESSDDLLSKENVYDCGRYNEYQQEAADLTDDSPLIQSESQNKIIFNNLNNNADQLNLVPNQEDILNESDDRFNNYPPVIGNVTNDNEKNIYEYTDIDSKITNRRKENDDHYPEENINDENIAEDLLAVNRIYQNIENFNVAKKPDKADFINRMRIHTHDSMENFMEKNDENLLEDQIHLEEKDSALEGDEEDQVYLENEEYYKVNPNNNDNIYGSYSNRRFDEEADLQYANSKNSMFNKTMNFNPSKFNKNFQIQNLDINEYNNHKTDNNNYIDYERENENNNANNHILNSNNNNVNNNPNNNSQSDSLPIADDYVGEDVFDENALDDVILFDGSKKSKIDFQREVKSKRPPTRYGNREDQVLWEKNQQQKSLNLHNNTGVPRNNQSDKHKNNKNLKNLFSDEEPEFDSRVKGESIKNKTLPKNVFSNKNKNLNYNNFLNKDNLLNKDNINNYAEEEENFGINNNKNFSSTNPKIKENSVKDDNKFFNQKKTNNPSNEQKKLEIKINENNNYNSNSNYTEAKSNQNNKNIINNAAADALRNLNRSNSSLNNQINKNNLNNKNNKNSESLENQYENDYNYNFNNNENNEDTEFHNKENKYRVKTLQTVNDEFNLNDRVNTNSNLNNNNKTNKNLPKNSKNLNRTNLDNNLDENAEASDFRKTLRVQLSKNHNKIFSNLKKFYMNNELKNTDSGKNSNNNAKNKSKSPVHENKNSPTYNNNNINHNTKNKNSNFTLNKNTKENFAEQEPEENYEPMDEEEFMEFHSYTNRNDYEPRNNQRLHLGKLKTSTRTLSSPDEILSERDAGKNKKKTSQNTSHVINTNLTESKYLIASSNKTPNFNYTVYKNN